MYYIYKNIYICNSQEILNEYDSDIKKKYMNV